jgi:hypothetical protein
MALKNPIKTFKEKNLDEIGVEIAQSAVKVVREELSEDWRASMRQMLGIEGKGEGEKGNLAGELNEGEEISFATSKTEKVEKKETRAEGDPDIRYADRIINAEVRAQRAETSEIKQRLADIHLELKKITDKSKELEMQFRQVAAETIQDNIKPGKYHLNFVEWMFSTIQSARVRIESSIAAMTLRNKVSKKGDYHSSAKAYGTSFTLSGERTPATQTG